jgi:pilus assembly protein CpaD
MTRKPTVPRLGNRVLAGAFLVASFALAGCKHDEPTFTASVPDDYRMRHPIAITEADRTVEVFVGNSRGGLSASQRADVIALGNTWMREGTGAIIADVPVGTPNARAAADSYREIRSLLAATGVPTHGVTLRHYKPDNARTFATVRLTYPRIAATAGPCGTWPEDLGTSVKNKSYLANTQYWNFGCANQRNLAAMVENPSDLLQPRPETPAYTNRRTVVLDKFRRGEGTATVYPDADKGKISSVGQ